MLACIAGKGEGTLGPSVRLRVSEACDPQATATAAAAIVMHAAISSLSDAASIMRYPATRGHGGGIAVPEADEN